MSELSYIESLNAIVRKEREAELQRCGTLLLSCLEINDKWGIWLEIGDEKLLVNPINLVNSIYKDDVYYMLDYQSKNMPGSFNVKVEKKTYSYRWTLSHSMLNISSENNYVQEEYVSKIFDAVSLLHNAVMAGGELAYDKDVDKESVVSCYKQLQVKCTWPSYIRKTTKDIQVEDFLFDIIEKNEGEHFSIGFGDRTYSTWFFHWDGDLEGMRHQFESYTFDHKAEIKISNDMSETIIKMEDTSVVDEINDCGKGISFKYKEYVIVTIFPNEFATQPIFKAYCDEKQILETLYNGLLRMALDHPISENDDVPGMLNAYNMIKSPIIEDYITGKCKELRNKMYAIRQTIVRHIITISPDVSQLFHDEEGYSYEVEKEGTIDFVYDRNGHPIVIKDLFAWHSEIEPIVTASETGHPYSMDWEEYHNRGMKLAKELRKVLSTDFDLWYETPFEDKSGIIKHPFLILEPYDAGC